MNECVLDASALLALLNKETGADIVEQMLPCSIMSTVNVSEVIAELDKRLDIPPQESLDMIEVMLAKIEPFDAELAMKTAALRRETVHLGLSFGDRACIALGLHLSLPIYTADKIWERFDTKIIKLIR